MKLLKFAAGIAYGGDRKKNFLLAAVIKRADGAIVVSQNISTKEPDPTTHAEARALRKADAGCTLYVARVIRTGGVWANAKPCKKCQALIRNRGVKKVIYTIGPGEYGVWHVKENKKP